MRYEFSAVGVDRKRGVRGAARVFCQRLGRANDSAAGADNGVSAVAWLMAAIVIATAVLLANGAFIWHRVDMAKLEDMQGVTAGYEQVQSWRDLAAYFFSSWIHVDYEGLRPLSGILYYFQCRLGYAFGWVWASWVSCLLLIVVCWLVAALTWRHTRSYTISIAAGLAFANIKYLLPGLDGAIPFLTWWVISDNLLCMIGFLGALIAFDIWRESDDRRYLRATCALFLAAALSKEFGYILPALLLVLSLLPATVARRRAVVASLAMCALSALLFGYRSFVLLQPHKPTGSRLHALRDGISPWLPPSPLEIFIMEPSRALFYLTCYAAAGYALWQLWRHRARLSATSPVWKLAALWTCVQLCYLPVLGFNLLGHYGLWAMALKVIFFATAADVVCRAAVSYQERIRLNRFMISPAVNARLCRVTPPY